MIEINVTETVIDLNVIENINVGLTTSNVDVELVVGQVIPSVEIDVGLQGPQGVIGLKGDKGDKGDIGEPLEFELLTEQQKLELRGDVGNTSTNYTNLFNSVLLS